MLGRYRSAALVALADERGAVATEYVLLVILVALGCSAALIGLGWPLLRLFHWQQAWLSLPCP